MDRRIIASELPGVLAWAVEGAKEYFSFGLGIPESIRRETADYRADTDLLGMWLTERTCEEKGARVAVAAAFNDYTDYCREAGASVGTKMSFGRQMTERGYKRDPGTSVRRLQGIRLLPASDYLLDEPKGGLDNEALALI